MLIMARCLFVLSIFRRRESSCDAEERGVRPGSTPAGTGPTVADAADAPDTADAGGVAAGSGIDCLATETRKLSQKQKIMFHDFGIFSVPSCPAERWFSVLEELWKKKRNWGK